MNSQRGKYNKITYDLDRCLLRVRPCFLASDSLMRLLSATGSIAQKVDEK
jgi:hypothetical protein